VIDHRGDDVHEPAQGKGILAQDPGDRAFPLPLRPRHEKGPEEEGAPGGSFRAGRRPGGGFILSGHDRSPAGIHGGTSASRRLAVRRRPASGPFVPELPDLPDKRQDLFLLPLSPFPGTMFADPGRGGRGLHRREGYGGSLARGGKVFQEQTAAARAVAGVGIVGGGAGPFPEAGVTDKIQPDAVGVGSESLQERVDMAEALGTPARMGGADAADRPLLGEVLAVGTAGRRDRPGVGPSLPGAPAAEGVHRDKNLVSPGLEPLDGGFITGDEDGVYPPRPQLVFRAGGIARRDAGDAVHPPQRRPFPLGGRGPGSGRLRAGRASGPTGSDNRPFLPRRRIGPAHRRMYRRREGGDEDHQGQNRRYFAPRRRR